MKNRFWVMLLLLTLLVPVTWAADDDDGDEDSTPLVIAYVDLQRVQDEWGLFQETLKQLEQEARTKEQEVQPKLDEYQTQLQELQQKLSGPISDEKRAEIRSEMERLYNEATQLQNGAVQAMQAREQQELQKLQEKIYQAIDQLGQDTEYDYILDMSNLIWAKADYDLTDQIIDILNKASGTD